MCVCVDALSSVLCSAGVLLTRAPARIGAFWVELIFLCTAVAARAPGELDERLFGVYRKIDEHAPRELLDFGAGLCSTWVGFTRVDLPFCWVSVVLG